MRNELLTIGPFTLYGYGLMIGIGILAAYLVAEYRARKNNLDKDLIFSLAIWCVVGGILGAKLLFIITQIKEIASNPQIILRVSDGFVVYGGIIGGIFSGFLFCIRKKINFIKYFDLTMPSIALAQGFGRIGCLLAGCCYGVPTKSHFGLIFPESSFAPSGVSLVPTQLISSGLDFLNFFVLIFLAKRVKADGQVAGFYLIFYSVGRFIIEFFRGDIERGKVGVLSTSQFIAIFLLVIGLAIVISSGVKAKHMAEQEIVTEKEL